MKRIRLVLALAAVMVVSLVAASPAYAVGDGSVMPAEGLLTADYVTGTIGDPNVRDALILTGGLFDEPTDPQPHLDNIVPGRGTGTVR